MTNPLDIVGKRYPGMPYNTYQKEDVVIGATYLLSRDYSDAHIVIARKKVAHSQAILEHNSYNWYATLVNPPVKQGDVVYALERADNDQNLRRERKRTVTEVTDEGIMTQYGIATPFLVTHWVLASGSADPKKDRFNPDRRKIVLDRLSKEGMDRIGDTGYATAAAEFFKHFDLPRPEVQPTAVLDIERKYDHNSMPRDLRYSMDDVGITSLRTALVTGRAKVQLAKSTCRCKEVTEEEATAAWRHSGTWKVVKVHKVECLWCTEIARVDEVV